MTRFHVYADEAGCFTFNRAPNVSRYFILCSIIMRECSVGNDLLALRRELAWSRAPVGEYFHATDDRQEVRDAVFATIGRHDFSVQATIIEKSKAQGDIRGNKLALYRYAWYYHLRFGISRQIPKSSEALITAAALGTRRERAAFTATVDAVLRQTMSRHVWRTDFPPACAEPCVQVADYCAWAIQRLWERGDRRSYDMIKDRITYEHELWKAGTEHYY